MFDFLFNHRVSDKHTPSLNIDVREAQTIKYLEVPGSPPSADLSLSIKPCVTEQMGRPVPSGHWRWHLGQEKHRCCWDRAERQRALSGVQSCFYPLEHDRVHPTDQAQPLQTSLEMSSYADVCKMPNWKHLVWANFLKGPVAQLSPPFPTYT